MKYPYLLFALLLIPRILPADERQPEEPKPPELKHQIGIEYNTNYFGNMGNVNYAYKFAQYASVFGNVGIGYLSLEQDSNGDLPTVSGSPGVNGKVSIFIQNLFDLGISVHFYKLNKHGLFRNMQLFASHMFLHFTHTFDAANQPIRVTGTKNYSIWGGGLGLDIYEYKFSETLQFSVGVKGYVFFLSLPQTVRYTDTVGNVGDLALFSSSADGQGLGMFPYPVVSLSLKYLW